MSEKFERRELHYSGRVQGVGFRATVGDVASVYQVGGFVQNLPDGRVRLVVEGETSELDRFLAATGKRLARYIVAVHEIVEPARGEFAAFSIRR